MDKKRKMTVYKTHCASYLGTLSHRKLALCFALIATLILIAYSNHFNNAFHFDDTHVIENNIFIRNISNIPLFFKDASTISSLPANQMYRPMVAVSLAVDYWIANGLTPFWFHVSTICWYLFQCFLLYFFFLKIINTSMVNQWNSYVALIAVAWYGLHTANAETINYISARSDSLSTCWFILSFVLFAIWPAYRKWGFYLIPLIVALLFKQTAIVFPALLFLYVLYFEEKAGIYELFKQKSGLALLGNILIVTLPSWVVCATMYILFIKMTPDTLNTGGASVYHYLITQPFVLLHYFQTFFLPLQLSADTDWKPLISIWDMRFFIGMAFVVTLLAFAVYTSKKAVTRPISFGIFWFFIALLPTSSLVPLAEVMNDHRIFFPFVGLVLAVAYSVYLIAIRNQEVLNKNSALKWCGLIGIFIVLTVHAYGTYQRNKVWKNGESLWYDVTIKSPENGRGLMNYGLTQMAKGNYSIAEHYFLKSLKYNPYYSVLHINLGVLKNAQGHSHEAEIYFQNALRFGPNYPAAFYYYANYLQNNKRYDEAERYLLKAIQLSPGSMDSRYSLMRLYKDRENWSQLSAQAKAILMLDSQDKEALESLSTSRRKEEKMVLIQEKITLEKYLALSLSYYNAQNYSASIAAAQNVIALKSDSIAAWNNICAAYNQLQKPEQAIIACQHALKINPNYNLAQNNLAWAYQLKAQSIN